MLTLFSLIFADIVLSTEAAIAISAILTALVGAISYIFKLLMSSKDKQLEDEKSRSKSYQEIAHEAVTSLEASVNELRLVNGLQPFKVVAPVVPEHNSPVTEVQQDVADLQSLRARVTAASLFLKIAPRDS